MIGDCNVTVLIPQYDPIRIAFYCVLKRINFDKNR